jgi:predicted component of type VI protein secretion system
VQTHSFTEESEESEESESDDDDIAAVKPQPQVRPENAAPLKADTTQEDILEEPVTIEEEPELVPVEPQQNERLARNKRQPNYLKDYVQDLSGFLSDEGEADLEVRQRTIKKKSRKKRNTSV